MALFRKTDGKKAVNDGGGLLPDFAYLDPSACYLDSACQTLRPQPVIDAEMAYYQQYGACGER
ncbi:MAG: hypothetical protein V1926_03900, partial [Candidatus Peregrinibacteria bacterium]